MNDVEAVKRWLEEYTASVNNGDFEKFLTFWAEDTMLLFPNEPIAKGRDALIEMAGPLFEQFDFEAEIRNEETVVKNNFGFIRVEFREKYIPKKDDIEQINVNAKGIFLIKQLPDASWVATHIILNNNPSSE